VAIEIGTAIVSYIEPAPGEAAAFNDWYERDHFPATVLAAPGAFAGGRFVATRACKDARPSGALLGDPQRGSYLALAWVLPGKQAEWDAWIAHEMRVLAAEDRLFPHREHLHTAVYRFVWERGDVPAIVALDIPIAGVIVLGHDVPIVGARATVGLALERTIVSSAEPPPHELVLAFCASDPIAAFGASAIPDTIAFASPFLSVVPGTDTHTEDL
jgi:hypothetical protein